jgi:hypothetical protein
MEQLIKRLKHNIQHAEKRGEDMNCRSWDRQEGCLISYNEAKAVLDALQTEREQIRDFTNWLQSRTEHLNHDFRDLVDEYLTNKDQHEVSKVKCDVCSYSWVAVRPVGLTELECPNCGRLCSFENE